MADSQAITSHQNSNGHSDGRREVIPHKDTTESLPAEMEIQRTRERISETTTQIQQQLKATMDWQGWVYRYPLQTFGLAAAAGIVTGFSLGGSSQPKRRPTRDARGGSQGKKEEELIKQTGQNTVVATVLTNIATTALREGSQYLVRRFFEEPNRPTN